MKIIRNLINCDAILTSDWHMMEQSKNPVCRLDNHFEAQSNKIKQINKLQKKYKCPIFFAGDLFEHWKVSPELINHCLKIFPDKIWGIPGQHDLPQHNINLINKSAFQTMIYGGKIKFLSKLGWWGFNSDEVEYFKFKNKLVIILHLLVYKDKEPFPGSNAPSVDKIFKMFPKADLILTGDNHMTFSAVSYRNGKKQILINPGSLTRHKADQINHKPSVFLWDSQNNSCFRYYLSVNDSVIIRDHLDYIKQKEEIQNKFINSLKMQWTTGLSFFDNIQKGIYKNPLSNSVKKYVLRWCRH